VEGTHDVHASFSCLFLSSFLDRTPSLPALTHTLHCSANAGQFRINKEDHTVCNLLRMQLLRDPSVRFAGYYHPHPLVHFINLKIQTNNSTVAPVEVLSSAIEDLANETDHLITQMAEAMETWKRENDAEF
jgi:DNA-directed RNA polymerase II subunit RPB11